MEEARDADTVVLKLRGELDLASADDVQRRLDALSGSGEPTRLDLDELAFMDSSGLRVVLQAAETSRERGLAVHADRRLRAGAPAVRVRRCRRAAADRPGDVTGAPVTVTLPRDRSAPRLARELLREHGDGLGPERLDTAVLLISELVTNAVLHGDGEIRLEFEPSSGRFAVSDEGGGTPSIRDEPGPDGGWGLRLVGRARAPLGRAARTARRSGSSCSRAAHAASATIAPCRAPRARPARCRRPAARPGSRAAARRRARPPRRRPAGCSPSRASSCCSPSRPSRPTVSNTPSV